MKVVLLAGGFGTRISEESQFKPKPMIEIGGMPILWHIMKEYSYYGFNEFIICAGYKQHIIKDWFANYFLHTSDITFDFTKGNDIIVHNRRSEKWKVTVVDTTGAGDAFYGTILTYIDSEGFDAFFKNDDSIKKTLKYANIMGANATLKEGAINSILSKEELEKY